MRFRFNGGLDCPDWVLTQIAAFTDIPSESFKTGCNLIVHHLKSNSTHWTESELSSITASGPLDVRALKAALAALSFIFEKASKYECVAKDLEAEMLQLGMSTERVKELREIYEGCHEELRRVLIKNFPKEPSLSLVDVAAKEVANKQIQRLTVKTSDGNSLQLALDNDQLTKLKSELELALSTFDYFAEST
uniref:COMM domain-containing protein n=1 Tax=Panagrellus redivivus TaxID=6233 RepID=A0A7E4V421_PANRE